VTFRNPSETQWTIHARVTLLALEFVALVALFTADDAVNHRGPIATWSTSIQVVYAGAIAVFLGTLLRALAQAGLA
jgi:hypothetical protein